MSPTSPLALAAALLESGELGESDPLWAAMRQAARKLAWPDCGARLLSFWLEARPRIGEADAARRAADWLPSLQPRDWAEAPRSEEVAQAVLEAFHSSPWRRDPIGRVADDKDAYLQRPGLPFDLRLSPAVPPDEAEGRLGAKNGRNLDTLSDLGGHRG